MKHIICIFAISLLILSGVPMQTKASGDQSAPSPKWMPGDPFDNYATIRLNFIKDVRTGQTRPPILPPTPNEAVNYSVILKPGIQEVISVGYLNVTVWYPTNPTDPRFGEYRMPGHNVREIDNEIPNMLACTRVYLHVKLWDQANRIIDSSNSQAAKDKQNYTVEGSCNWLPGSSFEDEMNITQDPYSAKDWRPLPPSKVWPGANMSSSTEITVRMASRHFIQIYA